MTRMAINSGHTGTLKRLKLNFFITALCLCFSLLSFGQTVNTASSESSSSAPKQYVKIAVGMHILDCPVLPKQLKEKLMTVKGIKNYHEDAMTQNIYFDMPEGAISREQIITIGTSCAFPPNTLTVFMDSKPFTN